MHELTRNVAEKPALAKETIREAFKFAGYDYYAAAQHLGLHHQTLRKHARTLKMTTQLAKERAKAIKRGERVDDNGRPKKPVPTADQIVKTYVRSKCVLADTAKALGVTAPTLRLWIKEHDLTGRLATARTAA